MSIILTPISDTTIETYISIIRGLIKDRISVPTVSLVKATGGSLSAGTINVRVSALTEFGETLPCTRVSLTVDANDKITITIGRIAEARAYRIYASSGTGTETLQAEVAPSQGAPTYTLSAIATGSAMPTTDTATIHADRDDYTKALESAVGEYSLNYPQELNSTITILSGILNYALPADYIDSFSSIRKVVYPGDSYPEDWLDHRDYVARAGYIYLDYPLTTGETMIVRYTTLHTVTSTADTVPDQHKRSVCLLAASNICLQVAVKYSHNSNKVIGADTVDYKLRADDFRKNAKTYRDEAESILGLTNGCLPTSSVANWGWYENR